jgi:hypothetical protein
MSNKEKRVIFPMHLLVSATLANNDEQQRLKQGLNPDRLLALGQRLKASLTKNFGLTCEFTVGLMPNLIRADDKGLTPNAYATTLAEQMESETEHPIFLLSEKTSEAIQGPAELRPPDLTAFPAVTVLTLPFVLCFRVEDFKKSKLAEDTAIYHNWRQEFDAVAGERCGTLTTLGIAAYHKLFAALDFINKVILMDKVADSVKAKATAFVSMDGADLLISKGNLYLPFYTFDEYAEAHPAVPDEELGKAYLYWLDRFRLLMYGLEKRNLSFKTINNLADFKTLELDVMEKITQATPPLPAVIETTVLDEGWASVRELVLDLYQDETRFVSAVLSGFNKNSGLVHQTNFHVSHHSGLQGMQDRVRELAQASGLDATVKTASLYHRGRQLCSPRVQVESDLAVTQAAQPALPSDTKAKTLH